MLMLTELQTLSGQHINVKLELSFPGILLLTFFGLVSKALIRCSEPQSSNKKQNVVLYFIWSRSYYFKSLLIAWLMCQAARIFSLSELVLHKTLNCMTFSINFQHSTSCMCVVPYYTNLRVVFQLFKGHLCKPRICLKETVPSSNLTELLLYCLKSSSSWGHRLSSVAFLISHLSVGSEACHLTLLCIAVREKKNKTKKQKRERKRHWLLNMPYVLKLAWNCIKIIYFFVIRCDLII